VLTGRKYRLAFTPEQAEFADTIGTICRSVWNTALEQRREYRRRGVWMNYLAQAGELADAKTEHEWLKAAPSHVLQQTLMDLDRACREHGTFKVRWRSGRRWNPSFRFPAGKQITVERLGRRWGGAKLPKLGWVRFRRSRALGGQVRSATVSRDGRHWYVSFLARGRPHHARTACLHHGCGCGPWRHRRGGLLGRHDARPTVQHSRRSTPVPGVAEEARPTEEGLDEP